MSSFELNKVAAAVLLAGIVFMLAGIIGGAMVEPEFLKKNVYVVAGVGEKPAETAAAPAETSNADEPIAPLLAKADPAAGEAQSKKCAACHTFTKDGPNRVGPNLWGVIGGPHDHRPDFSYSPAMAALKDKTWDYQALSKFLTNPKADVPGTKMTFAGLPKIQDRANLLAWLRTQSDSPVPLPAP